MSPKLRSCGSLAAGNDALLAVKTEQSKLDRKYEIEEKKKAMEAELARLLAEENSMEEEEETQPATEEELASAKSKRAPPPSTKSTPVKGLAVVKKARGDGKDKVAPGETGSTVEDTDAVKSLEVKLAAALQQIELLKGGQGTPSTAGTKGTPSSAAKGSTPSPATSKSSATPPSGVAKAKAKAAPAAPAANEDEDSDAEGIRLALQRYKMVDARLRRLCEKKPSGKVRVPQAIHEQWMAGGKQRDELRALLEEFNFDKEVFVHKVTKMIELRKEDTQEILKGWFTTDQMKAELHWSSPYIKEVVAYCKKAGLVKNDKYSAKVFRYFVEYSDKESSKKSRVESHQHSSTGEADGEVQLQDDWIQPTRETEPEDGGKVQAPAEGEIEVEEKFQDGMLTKMSKNTDLISRLDSFTSTSDGSDQSRVKKSIDALEKTLSSAQAAYDSFAGARAAAPEVESRSEEITADLKGKMRVAMQKASLLASVEVQAKALEKNLKKKKRDADNTEAEG